MSDIEARLSRLEDIAFEGNGLQRAVTRLGMNANALGEALLTVDRNQQKLTQLGLELKEVRSTSVSDVEVQATVRAEKRIERRKLLWVALMPIVLVMLGMIFVLSESAHDSCEKRHEATEANIDVLRSFAQGSTGPQVQMGIKRLQGTIEVSCDDQYLLHLP